MPSKLNELMTGVQKMLIKIWVRVGKNKTTAKWDELAHQKQGVIPQLR